MKKEAAQPVKMESLSDIHRAFGLPAPVHPLISFIDGATSRVIQNQMPYSHVLNFYKISYKPNLGSRLKYGQGYYDFDEGGLLFAAPNQMIGPADANDKSAACSLYTLLIHPDFLWNFPLAKKIKQYGFFSYAANEVLHLSESEKATIISVFKMIGDELSSKIDDLSQEVVISQIELMLTYANRFYKRQFITRKVVNSNMLQNLETLLDDYFNNETPINQGLPTVAYLADHLNLSASYLSDMLRSLIGQTAQQYIHSKLIEKAKEKLSATNLSVSEIAYALGFEHSQSFSKLFKLKTNSSPLAFRRMFN